MPPGDASDTADLRQLDGGVDEFEVDRAGPGLPADDWPPCEGRPLLGAEVTQKCLRIEGCMGRPADSEVERDGSKRTIPVTMNALNGEWLLVTDPARRPTGRAEAVGVVRCEGQDVGRQLPGDKDECSAALPRVLGVVRWGRLKFSESLSVAEVQRDLRSKVVRSFGEGRAVGGNMGVIREPEMETPMVPGPGAAIDSTFHGRNRPWARRRTPSNDPA